MNRLVPGSLLILAACSVEAPLVEPEGLLTQSTHSVAPPPPECGYRYIGLPSGPVCPPADPSPATGVVEWDVAPLFTPIAPTSVLGERMNRYCAYDWNGAGPRTLGGLPMAAGNGNWLVPECPNTMPLGGLEDLGEAFSVAHAKGAEFHPLSDGAPDLIRVAVVDSSPTEISSGDPGAGQLTHGRNVGLTIKSLACPDGGTCTAKIVSHLGLPRIKPQEVNKVDGGRFAHPSELAEGIRAAVDEWIPNVETEPRLIINLSVGWQGIGDYTGDLDAELPLNLRTVHDAIVYARCHGALVVAAAGNRLRDGGDDGLMYPAAWMDKAANLDSALERCGAAPVPMGAPIAAASPRAVPLGYDDPLVIAVAALNGKDEPHATARDNSRTPLEAHANRVSYYDDSLGGPSTAMSGSSFAAATVSAAAAVAWGHASTLAPTQLYDVLYSSARTVSTGLADVSTGGGGHMPVRRVSICKALEAACIGATAGVCPSAIDCATTEVAPFEDITLSPSPTLLAALDAVVTSAAPEATADATSGGLTEAPADPCMTTVAQGPFAHDPGGPAWTACYESVTPAGAEPWVTPQPWDLGCGVCYGHKTDFSGHIRVDEPPTGTTVGVYYPMLRIHHTGGGGTTLVDLASINPDLKTILPGKSYAVKGVSGLDTAWRVDVLYTLYSAGKTAYHEEKITLLK